METLKQKIYEIGIGEIKEGNFSGSLTVEENAFQRADYKAHTGLQNKEIYFSYNPKVIEKKGEKSLIKVSKDATSHEIDHHQYKGCIGCPQNVDKDNDLFFEPMYEVLKEKGFGKSDVDYATNALQDTILHRDLKINAKKDLDGIVTFFESVAENNGNKLTDFYEAHVKLNMDLWAEKNQKNKFSKFYSNDSKVDEVLRGFYAELNEGKFKDTINVYTRSKCKTKKGLLGKTKREWTNREDKEIEIFDKQEIRKYLLNEDNWKEISKIYAKHFSKLMTPNYAMQTMDHSGAGTNGREGEDSNEEGNPFKKERESRNFKKGKVIKASKNGDKAPSWISDFEAMDVLYESLAEQIEIMAESYTNPETFPISWYGEREFNPERDDFKHTKFGINEGGEVELRKKRYSVDVPINVKNSPKSFPQIKFGMFDLSGSMQSDIKGGDNIGNTSIIKWGDNSKYHWQILTQMGIFEYFKKNHLLTQNSISAATYGEDTQVVQGYQNVKEHLLNPVFEGSTQLEIGQVKQFFEGEGNLIYTGGDGQIGNWSSIKDEFIGNAKKHSYVHFHFGKPNKMTRDLENAGLEVIVGEDGKGIVNKVVDLTDKIIRGNGQ